MLEFVGLQHSEFRFDRKFRALLGGTRTDLIAQVNQGFPFLPAGCHIELDSVASRIVLDSIRNAIPSRWPAKVEELRSYARASENVSLAGFLQDSGLDLDDVYAGDKSWSDLCQDAGLPMLPPGPEEAALRRACGRLLHIDDPDRIDAYRRLLSLGDPPDPNALPVLDRRRLRMVVASLTDKVDLGGKEASLADGCRMVWRHPQVLRELQDLLGVLSDRVEHLPNALSQHPNVPLAVHARYTRIEILAAFGVGDSAKVMPWQSGVFWARDERADLLVFTLDKTSGQFSPTTRYRDYAISRDLIHWESQSGTRADSETGLRYQQHVHEGSSVMLFARLRTDDRAFYFLGPASYVKHEGELPMAVTWRLDDRLPGDLFNLFAAAVA